MAMQSPQAVAARWQAQLAQSTDKIKQGVMAVTEAPTARAARRIDAQVAGVQRAAASGKTQAALMRVDLNSWQQSFINKGLGRIAGGSQAAVPKMAAFLTQFLPAVESARASLQPRGDLETNIQRSADMARKLSQFQYRPQS